jgi:prepilin-type N-terminal cleavage/methylation domain-containing protein
MLSLIRERHSKKGFTLIEVLIVVAILAILMITLLVSVRSQRAKAEDARIKSDLERLRIAFEDYYNDNNCYPSEDWFDDSSDCGTNYLQPYLSAIPCDKKTNEPYRLFYAPTQCSGFQLYAKLQNYSDPSYTEYYDSSSELVGTYGVSSSNVTLSSPGDSGLGMSGGEQGNHNYYWCSGTNNCTSYDPSLFSCSPSYTDNPNCDEQGCVSTGSCTPL